MENTDNLHVKLDRYEIFECSEKHKGGIVACRIPVLMPEVSGKPKDVKAVTVNSHILNKDDVNVSSSITVSNYVNLKIPSSLVDEINENGVLYDPPGTKYIGYFVCGDISRPKIVEKE